jgi:hypothetical protein
MKYLFIIGIFAVIFLGIKIIGYQHDGYTTAYACENDLTNVVCQRH